MHTITAVKKGQKIQERQSRQQFQIKLSKQSLFGDARICILTIFRPTGMFFILCVQRALGDDLLLGFGHASEEAIYLYSIGLIKKMEKRKRKAQSLMQYVLISTV